MPFIDVNISTQLTFEKERTLKAQFGKIICEIPGKTEGSVMIQFKDNARLWFRGSNESPMAFVNVMLYGKAQESNYRVFSEKTMDLLNREMGIEKSNIYIKFEEVANWFWG